MFFLVLVAYFRYTRFFSSRFSFLCLSSFSAIQGVPRACVLSCACHLFPPYTVFIQQDFFFLCLSSVSAIHDVHRTGFLSCACRLFPLYTMFIAQVFFLVLVVCFLHTRCSSSRFSFLCLSSVSVIHGVPRSGFLSCLFEGYNKCLPNFWLTFYANVMLECVLSV